MVLNPDTFGAYLFVVPIVIDRERTFVTQRQAGEVFGDPGPFRGVRKIISLLIREKIYFFV